MNEHQYRQLCENRRATGPLPLSAASTRAPSRHLPLSPLAAVVAAAARATRQRAKAVRAWQRVALPEWLAATVVEALDGDTLVVAVEDPTLGYELRRRTAALVHALGDLVPGLRRVRWVVRGPDGAR